MTNTTHRGSGIKRTTDRKTVRDFAGPHGADERGEFNMREKIVRRVLPGSNAPAALSATHRENEVEAGGHLKMVHPELPNLNQLFEELADWNRILEDLNSPVLELEP